MADEWYSGFDDTTRGYLENKGWSKLDPVGAIGEALKSYRELESKIGIPADRLVKWPDAEDKDGMKAIHARLGVPADATGYDFTGVKKKDGTPAEAPFLDFMRQNAAALNLPKDAAQGLAAAFVQFGEQTEEHTALVERAAVAVAQDALKANWGANFETNKFVADRAASLLKLTPDVLNVIAEHSSYGAVMEGLLNVGRQMGEAALVGAGGPGGGATGPMTREQAISRKDELMADSSFFDRWYSKDSAISKAAVRELENLDRLIAVGGGRAA